MAALRDEVADDPAATSRRLAAARERAARERDERDRRALHLLPELKAVKARNQRKDREPSEARVSTTDPDARVMRMGDGGWRPASNIQLTSDVESGLVCGVAVSHVGSDQGLLEPAVRRIRRAFARNPTAVLADGGFVALADIEALEGCGIAVHAPVPTPRDGTPSPVVRADDGPGTAAWRARMATNEAKLLYRARGASIEWVNAFARNRGLQLLRVCGEQNVRSVALWFALAHNLARASALGNEKREKAAAVG